MEGEIIRSRQNKIVKLVSGLEKKKQRGELFLFRFDGIKLLFEALSKGIEPEYIVIAESRYAEIERRIPAVASSRHVVIVCDEVFEKMSTESAPEGVITVARFLDGLHKATKANSDNEVELPASDESVLVLEAIRDPGNLGTMIRTAASLGIDRLVLSSDCADIYNPKTIRGAMGALFMQRITLLEEVQTSEYLSQLKKHGRRVFAAALRSDAARLGSFDLCKSDVFVIGNEGHGLTDETIEACDGCVIIPMREGCESLNAAMAAGIIMWEMHLSGEKE